MSWTEIVGPPGIGKTTLQRNLAEVRVPPCGDDMRKLLAAIESEVRDWTGSERVRARLHGLKAVVAGLPSTDRVIADGPVAWIGAVASRDEGMEVAERLATALPPFRIVYLTATRNAIVARLRNRGGHRRHIERVGLYVDIADRLVKISGADVVIIDTTNLDADQVASAARDALCAEVTA
jgi:broad-specificity NMP kinase